MASPVTALQALQCWPANKYKLPVCQQVPLLRSLPGRESLTDRGCALGLMLVLLVASVVRLVDLLWLAMKRSPSHYGKLM